MTSNLWDTVPCRQEDPELFFPVSNNLPCQPQIDKAKAICGLCPLVEECLTLAYELGARDGIWGGQTSREREASARRYPLGKRGGVGTYLEAAK